MGLDNMRAAGTPLQPTVNPVTQASAASLANAISYFITKISGTNAMTGFRLPKGFRGLFCVIPTGASSFTTGGTLAYASDGTTEDIPFAKAGNLIANVATLFVSDGALIYPVANVAELID